MNRRFRFFDLLLQESGVIDVIHQFLLKSFYFIAKLHRSTNLLGPGGLSNCINQPLDH